MNTGTRVAAFLAALAVVFAVSTWAGRAFGPDSPTPAGHAAGHSADPAAHPGGLQVTQDGYTLDLAQPLQRARRNAPVQFRILDAAGVPVTRFQKTHDQFLHLIVVRNDLSAFQHLHPVLDDDGLWRVPIDFSRAGDYRLFADFVPVGGPPLTLAANVHVAGDYDPQPLPDPGTTATVDDYTVTLTGTAKAGAASTLSFSVTRNGAPVGNLQRYLGAYGHLVALRAADLAYLHVHPLPSSRAAGPIEFSATFPSAGEYRLFLDFKHRDTVRTAAFTVVASEGSEQDHNGDGHGH
ncbi:hypothetical protein [Mycolicibacterium phlei]|jgi:hypothetical protein